MPIFKRHDITCHLCHVDPFARAIRLKLQETSNKIRDEWEKAESIVLLDEETYGHLPSKCLLNGTKVTVIPDYLTYCETWKKSMYNVPFDYDWEGVDLHWEWDRYYVRLVYETVRDQLVIYAADSASEGSDVLKHLMAFYDAIFELYKYTVHNCVGDLDFAEV